MPALTFAADGFFVRIAGIIDEEGLEELGGTGQEVAAGEGPEDLRAFEREFGLADDSQHVFEIQEVDAGFSADGGIDLCQQGGGHEGKADSPAVDAGGKAGQVCGDAPAHGQEQGTPVGPCLQEPRTQVQHGGHVFGFFRGIEDLHSGRRAGCSDFLCHPCHIAVIDQKDLGIGLQQGGERLK